MLYDQAQVKSKVLHGGYFLVKVMIQT